MGKFDYYCDALSKKYKQREGMHMCYTGSIACGSSKRWLDFSSSDYLGISSSVHVGNTACELAKGGGAECGSMSVAVDHLQFHQRVESTLKVLVGKEAVMLFSSAYRVYQQLFAALMHDGAFLFIDRCSPMVLLQAALGSRARVFKYEHHHLQQLADLLRSVPKRASKWIVSESLSGITGRVLDVDMLLELADEYDALVFLDDSNCLGVIGRDGMGAAAHKSGVDMVLGGFGCHAGTLGAYIGTSELLKEYLLMSSPELVEMTMVSPLLLRFIGNRLDLIPHMHLERDRLQLLSKRLRDDFDCSNWDIDGAEHHIIPITCFSQDGCQRIFNGLIDNNISVAALAPPVVAEEMSRLRISLQACHQQGELSILIETLNYLRKRIYQ